MVRSGAGGEVCVPSSDGVDAGGDVCVSHDAEASRAPRVSQRRQRVPVSRRAQLGGRIPLLSFSSCFGAIGVDILSAVPAEMADVSAPHWALRSADPEKRNVLAPRHVVPAFKSAVKSLAAKHGSDPPRRCLVLTSPGFDCSMRCLALAQARGSVPTGCPVLTKALGTVWSYACSMRWAVLSQGMVVRIYNTMSGTELEYGATDLL
eukprot:3049369-Rhodomonas_salina.2